MRNKTLIIVKITLTFLIIFSISCSKEKRSVITGTLENPLATKIYLAEFNLVSSNIIDSAQLSAKGKFKFMVKHKEPRFYQILSGKNDFVLLLVAPGERLEIKADASNIAGSYNVNGSELSLEVKKLNDKLARSRFMLDSLRRIAVKNEGTAGYENLVATLDTQYVAIVKEQRMFSIKYIIENLTSMASIVPLYQQIDENNYVLNQNRDLQYVKLLSDTLQKYYPESKVVKTLYSDRQRLLQEFNKLKILQKVGQSKEAAFPDLALLSILGDTVKLSSLKASLILLNFWDPYNEDCMYVQKGLIEIYAKYKNKGLEIYNVALFNDLNSWKAMVAKYKLAGIQLIEPLGVQSPALKIYNVSALPADFLLGNEGIIAKDLFGERLDLQLGQLLK